MRNRLPLRAACALALGSLLVCAPAEASVSIGGPSLATHGVIVPRGAPPLPATVASSWVVADLDTGNVLAARDAHGQFAPASTLKILTAETLIPRLNPRSWKHPTFDDVNVDGTKAGLVQQLTYSVPDLFRAMLVVSGNDAAMTLATANGGLPRTVVQMNAEARRLKALDTRAINPDGLDAAGQFSSAYDLALIARAAMKIPAFRTYVATKHTSIPAPNRGRIALTSHDKLLFNYPGAIGIKNGYTVASRASFVGAATRGGHTLVVTLMHTAPRFWPEAATLLNWGFTARAAGVSPVGHLVEPEGSTTSTAAGLPATATRPGTEAASNAVFDDTPLLAGALVGISMVVIVVGVMRRRSVRRRRRRRRPMPIRRRYS